MFDANIVSALSCVFSYQALNPSVWLQNYFNAIKVIEIRRRKKDGDCTFTHNS